MKKIVLTVVACVAGIVALALLLPLYDAPAPITVQITRDQARALADVEARKIGIDVDHSWPVTVWETSDILEDALKDSHTTRRNAIRDNVLGPRLGYYHIEYFSQQNEKFPQMGDVYIGPDGRNFGARRRARPEEPAPSADPAVLRARADEFIRTHELPGAPHPQFESMRPNVQRTRTDTMFRYRVASKIPIGDVALYMSIHFIGDRFAGWIVTEEYASGRQFQSSPGAAIAGTFGQYAIVLALMLVLLIVFLRKYHAGEVGIGTGALLFGLVLLISLLLCFLRGAEDSTGVGFGGLTASLTGLAFTAFHYLFYSIPLGVLVFLAWSVGESYARERWGERLASFDAILRRDPINASVGRSLMIGVGSAPAVAAFSLLLGAIPMWSGLAHPVMPDGVRAILSTRGSVVSVLADAIVDATVVSVIALLFMLAASNRRRIPPLGFAIAAAIGTFFLHANPVPIDPIGWQLLFGIGAPIAAAIVFMSFDLLAAATCLFFSIVLTSVLPYLMLSSGPARVTPLIGMIVPIAAVFVVAIAGLMTRREIAYSYEDLAPHVRRIVERERVKAEIDAANRIQAALLPSTDPVLHGAAVSSHYRAASEIGGDYFDFLTLPEDQIGIAFGDVSGHGLTSGIVMAMAKSALLVQVGYDHAPVSVLEVLNETVIKTAPRRMLMTFFFGVLDPIGQRLRFSSAGHHDPYVYRAREKRIEALSAWGFPLGVKRREPFREYTVEFEPGDRLILYSDGLIEALDDDGEPFGFDRFERVLSESGNRSAEEIKKALLNSVKKFTHNRPPEDDQTLVVISFHSLDEHRASA